MEPTIFKPRLKFKPALKFFKFGHQTLNFKWLFICQKLTIVDILPHNYSDKKERVSLWIRHLPLWMEEHWLKFVLKFSQLLTPLKREQTSFIGVLALQFGGGLRFLYPTGNVHRVKQDFIFSLVQLKEGVLTPDWYTSHAQRYRLFTPQAARTGLLWKISLNGALGP